MKSLLLILFIQFNFFLISDMGYSQEFEMPSFVHAIDACDMDMDGSNDIIVSCAYSDTIVILFNDGHGNFDPYYYERTTGYLLCGCIDEDNLPDIISVTNDLNYIKNNGDRTFSNGLVPLIEDINFPIDRIIDVNDDGLNDIVYNRDSYWGIFENNGDLIFSNTIFESDGGGPAQPSFGYLNYDSLPDVVISYSYNYRTSVTKYLLNDANFNFTEFVLNNNNYKPIVSNLNNIFPDDITLFYTPTPEVHLYENIGDSTFVLHGIHYILNSAGVYFKNSGDYDLDGFDDFCYTQCFWSGCMDSLYVEINDQLWSYNPAQKYFIGTINSFMINSIDLNGDHFPDFYMTGYNSNMKVKILWNNGDGTFSYENPVGITEDIKDDTIWEVVIKPNPFNSLLHISLTSKVNSQLKITVLDLFGRWVRDFETGLMEPGENLEIDWDGTDFSGQEVRNGIYFLSISDGNKNYLTFKIIKLV